MSSPITARLQALQTEYETGQKMLAELDAKRSTLTSTLLRIEGAIQVLKELSAPASPAVIDIPGAPTASAS